jgi:hypothetical protein
MSFVDNGSAFDTSGIGFSGGGFPYAGSADASGFDPNTGAAKSSSLFGNVSGSSLAGAGVAGGLLGYDLLKGNPTDPNMGALSSEAGALAGTGSSLLSTGQGLQSYLQQGTLPPGLQAKVEQDTQANKARITQNAATTGSSADPRQNSALTQDLANADRSGTAESADYQMKLAQTGQSLIDSGLKATGMSSQLYESLYKYDQQQNSDLMSSIASFAKALVPIAGAAIGGPAGAAAGGAAASLIP